MFATVRPAVCGVFRYSRLCFLPDRLRFARPSTLLPRSAASDDWSLVFVLSERPLHRIRVILLTTSSNTNVDLLWLRLWPFSL
uniref:Uncharacterized protein n=1 Tax=Pyronema omphalodes (strain CBS 100304) TaxID=1076935 RepID=U4LV12_PYROM